MVLLAAVPAFADFEGVMDMKITVTDKDGNKMGGGTASVAISKTGERNEVKMETPMGPMNMVMLHRTENPDVTYRINDANKTYSEMDLAKAREMAAKNQDNETYTVKKLGEEKVLGYKAQHVLVGHKDSTNEMWITKDIMDYDTFAKLQARQGRGGNEEAISKALKEAGADGVPLKSVMNSPDGGKAVMEVTSVEKKSLPASMFQLPEGYTKSAGGMMDMMSNSNDPRAQDARKKMEERLKNLPPEQREMIEKMMKQRQGGVPAAPGTP